MCVFPLLDRKKIKKTDLFAAVWSKYLDNLVTLSLDYMKTPSPGIYGPDYGCDIVFLFDGSFVYLV